MGYRKGAVVRPAVKPTLTTDRFGSDSDIACQIESELIQINRSPTPNIASDVQISFVLYPIAAFLSTVPRRYEQAVSTRRSGDQHSGVR
jgi:hypothetical protein